MNVDPLFYLRSSDAEPALPELSIVALRVALTVNDARVLPAEA